jgi:hypothetical protein
MAKTKISEYSQNASNNTDVGSINLSEGMAPSLVNNSIRELMSHIKDFQAGSSGDTLRLTGKLTVDSSAEITSGLSVAGNFVSTGTFSPSALSTSLLTASGGTIDGMVIGASSASTGTFTIINASTKINGPVSAASVIANTVSAGNVHGSFHGSYSGDLTGTVNHTTGTSTVANLIVTGKLDLDASTTATLTGLSAPTANTDAATKKYVDDSISNLVSNAPTLLNTLGEISDAINDDPEFHSNVTSAIGTKLALTGGSITGTLSMGGNTINNLGSASTSLQAVPKSQMDSADALKLSLSGGTMSGDIAMGGSRVTGLNETPTASSHATSKAYVDNILGSGTNAASAAASALVSAASAQSSKLAAASSEAVALTHSNNAATQATNAAASFDEFDDIYLGTKSSDPSTDNDGDALASGALYFNTSSNTLRVFDGSSFNRAAFDVGTAVTSFQITGGSARTGAVTLTTAEITTLATNTFEPKGEAVTQAVAMALVFGG